MKSNAYNGKLMAKLLTSAYLFLAASAVMIASSQSMANGKGYGGADFVSESVPKEFDKAMLPSGVDKAQLSCQQKYVVPVLQDMCKKLGDESGGEINGRVFKCGKPRSWELNGRFLSFSMSGREDNIEASYISNVDQSFSLKAIISHLSINSADIIKSGSYDDFKRYIPNKNRIKKVTLIRFPDGYFYNYMQDMKTNFVVPNERIADCIESELQKLANSTEE